MMKTCLSCFSPDGFYRRMFSAAAIVASFCLLGTANAGEAALPDDQPAVVSGEYSPEGRRLFVTVVVLPRSLVGM